MRKFLHAQKNLKKLFFAASLMVLATSYGQLQQGFTPRYSETINGDFAMIANNVLSRDAVNAYNGSQSNHDFSDNIFVDIDSDPTTFNSSSANLANPAPGSSCLTIERVFLYWAAADKEYEVDGTGNILAGDGGPEVSWNYDDIKLMLPGDTDYGTTLTADEVVYRGRDHHFVNDPYICVKDITNMVQGLTNPFGAYQVANVKATEGRLFGHDGGNVGTSGGWQIVFVWQSPTMPQKNVTLFDGYAHITATENNFDVTFDGFQTVPNGQVNANMVIGSFEGDRGISQDQLLILDRNNTWEPLTTPLRPADNFFNSRITTNGVDFTDRMPASTNTLGFDASSFELRNNGNQLITNNQTSAVVRMTSNQETYGLYLLGLAVEVWEPSLNQLDLYATASSENPVTGETIQIYLDVANTGNDNIRNLNFTTTIPDEMIFVGVEPLPSEITYNFNNTTRELTFMVADGHTDVSSAPYLIQYALRVQDDAYFATLPACTFESNSQTTATFSGEINTSPQTANSSFTFDECGVGNGDQTLITISITDIQAPVFIEDLPSDITVECDQVPDPAILTAIDNCDSDPIVTFNETATNNRDCSMGYEITRTWTASDNVGLSFTHTQIITINGNPCLTDDEAPVFVEELPADITVYCDSIPEATILTAVDNCDDDPTVTFVETATNEYNCETGFEITRTWTATDDSGNEMTHTQIIIVNSDLPCNIDDLVVSKTITANADGVNDLFEITGLEGCNYTYTVKIFNRWGNIVYESNDYANDWGAIAPANAMGSSGMLPSGTYYYIIGFGTPQVEPVNGYIYIGSN
mgnify:CR=1 FL=1